MVYGRVDRRLRPVEAAFPWTPDTLVHVFSAGKAVIAAALLRPVDSSRQWKRFE